MSTLNSFYCFYRLEGFLLLNQYLEECEHLLNTNETVSWSTHCLQSLTVSYFI